MLDPVAQPCYVLHGRAYKESSALVDLFTPQGRLRAVLRNARGKSGSLARPFVGLEVTLRGRGELKSVSRLEAAGPAFFLQANALFSGLYLNELLMRLLAADDPQPDLFQLYASTLQALAGGRPLEPLLRAFEWRLLGELGYGFSLEQDVDGAPIQAAQSYRFDPEQGLQGVHDLQPGCFSGLELQAMAQADWQFPGALAAAKRLMRQAMAPHLGGRPLVSRELFMNRKELSRD